MGVPQNVKNAANNVAKDAQHVASQTGEGAKNVAMRIKNGNPNIHTTTLAPREPHKRPVAASALSQLHPAINSLKHYAMHWAWPVLHSVLLISGVFALTELCVATGRHMPSYQKSCMVAGAGVDALLVNLERPVTTFALGTCYKSYFGFRFLVGLLPWTAMAPTILGYTPSSPYELMIPVALVAFGIGGMLVLAI